MSDIIVGGNNLIAAITGGVFGLESPSRSMVGSDLLLASPASILAAYIIDEMDKMSWPIEKDNWPLYISHMPDGDNVETNCGAIYDTSGVLDSRQMDGRIPLHPGIQIRIRSKDYETGFAKIEDLASELDTIAFNLVTIATGIYEIQNVSRTTNVVSLGIERGTKRRFLFTINYLLTMKKLN